MCAAPIPGAAPGPGSHQKFSHVDAAGQAHLTTQICRRSPRVHFFKCFLTNVAILSEKVPWIFLTALLRIAYDVGTGIDMATMKGIFQTDETININVVMVKIADFWAGCPIPASQCPVSEVGRPSC